MLSTRPASLCLSARLFSLVMNPCSSRPWSRILLLSRFPTPRIGARPLPSKFDARIGTRQLLTFLVTTSTLPVQVLKVAFGEPVPIRSETGLTLLPVPTPIPVETLLSRLATTPSFKNRPLHSVILLLPLVSKSLVTKVLAATVCPARLILPSTL